MDQPVVSRRDQWLDRLKRLWQMRWQFVPFLGGMIAAFAAISLYTLLTPKEPALNMTDVNAAVERAIASITPVPAYSAQVYSVIQPSLVLIQATFPSEDGDDSNGLGSGVIVNNDGAILTSLHVVDGASDITVFFADGTESYAVIMATQPEKDIAVLQPTVLPDPLIPATLGNPNSMRVGDEVFAVGHPFGLYGSMSAGVISGFNRTFFMEDGETQIEGLIQIDAAINPGNSGGPLLNRRGQVIGIVTGILNPIEEEFFIGIGFAVPIDVAGGAAGLPPQ